MPTRTVVKADGTVEEVELTPEEIAQAEIDAARNTAFYEDQAAEEVRLDATRAEADTTDLMNRLRTATPAQVDTWIDNNVTSLASARAVLKAIVKVLVLIVKRQTL